MTKQDDKIKEEVRKMYKKIGVEYESVIGIDDAIDLTIQKTRNDGLSFQKRNLKERKGGYAPTKKEIEILEFEKPPCRSCAYFQITGGGKLRCNHPNVDMNIAPSDLDKINATFATRCELFRIQEEPTTPATLEEMRKVVLERGVNEGILGYSETENGDTIEPKEYQIFLTDETNHDTENKNIIKLVDLGIEQGLKGSNPSISEVREWIVKRFQNLVIQSDLDAFDKKFGGVKP